MIGATGFSAIFKRVICINKKLRIINKTNMNLKKCIW